MYPLAASPGPSSSSSAAAPAPHGQRRPKGLWKARGTLPPRWANHTPENKSYSHRNLFAEHLAFNHYDDSDDLDSDDSDASSKRRRLHSESPPTSDDEVLYWDYSRKCSPHPERLDKWTTRTKLMDTSSTAGPGQPQPSTAPPRAACDLEDWEDLKELFAKAVEIYEAQSPTETLPLLRGVIHECHRFMLAFQDPSVLYATPAKPVETPPDRRVVRDWLSDRPLYPPPGEKEKRKTPTRTEEKEKKCKCKDLATAFYTILGTTLFFFGNLIEHSPELAMPGEPSTPLPFWLAAVDVFETGENLPIRTSGKGCQGAPEDWRMAVVWGRTLVSIAHEFLRRQHAHPSSSMPSTPATTPGSPGVLSDYGFPGAPQAMPTAIPAGVGTADEPAWPPDSPFGLIAARRPPMTTRGTILTLSPHELMVLAQDQFSRGILHMPHPLHSQRSRHQAKLEAINAAASDIPASFSSTPVSRPYGEASTSPRATTSKGTQADASSTAASCSPSTSSSGSSSLQQTPETFSRAKELFTIASDVLVVAEKLEGAEERQAWASYADSVFSQMRMELADMAAWGAQITASRGRCQLVVGTARVEELEARIEAGDAGVWDCEEAVDAREALGLAVGFIEKARNILLEEREASMGMSAGAAVGTTVQEVDAEIMVEDNEGEEDGEDGMTILVAPKDADAEREEEIEELGKLLGEALLDLANLTRDKREQEALYARALKAGGDAIELDADDEDEDDRMDEGF